MSARDPDNKDENCDSKPGEHSENNQTTEERPKEIGGRKGPEPTRFGDWEKGGRCIDF